MDERERELAEFLVELASIPTATEAMSSDDAEAFEKRIATQAQRQIRGASRTTRAYLRAARRRSGLDKIPAPDLARLERRFLRLATRLREDLARAPKKAHEFRKMIVAGALGSELPGLHKRVRSTLTSLFGEGSSTAGRSVISPLLVGRAEIDARDLPSVYLVRKGNEVLTKAHPDASLSAQLMAEFVRLLTQKACPFGRCPVCAQFFVRKRRQKFCSTACTSRGVEAKRKGTRREYQRNLMRRRRELEREKARLAVLRKKR